jgi:hypothetical protein
VRNELIRLEKFGDVKSRFYRKQKWYFPASSGWEDVKNIVDEKAELVAAYAGHKREFYYGNKRYDDYSEFLVEGPLRQAGYLIMARNTNYFDGKIYQRAVARPGVFLTLTF